MKPTDGLFRQRVGNLIEKNVCEMFNLTYNTRQQTKGYYDAYNKDNIYEIKASSINYNTFVIRPKNHKLLLDVNGAYIFISYSLINKDKDLRVISDIKIENRYIISAYEIDKCLKKYGSLNNEDVKRNRKSYRIQLSNILKAKDIKRTIEV